MREKFTSLVAKLTPTPVCTTPPTAVGTTPPTAVCTTPPTAVCTTPPTHVCTTPPTAAHTTPRTAARTTPRTPARTTPRTPARTTATTHAHTTTTTHAHTQSGTPTAEQLHRSVQQLGNENASLKRQIAELTTRCNNLVSELNDVKLQLAQFTTAPRLLDHHTTLRRGWHEQANDKIGASHSRASPTREYGCAHAGCNWRNKKVTLQAYVLHLKRKHGENISDNPDLSLLPVPSR